MIKFLDADSKREISGNVVYPEEFFDKSAGRG
jgi:hypothetical protein